MIGDIVHWLAPLIRCSLLHIFMICQVLEPRVFLCSVPVFHFCRDGDDGAGSHLDGFFTPFLIPATAGNANQHLHLLVVNVPVVAATRLEGDVHDATTDICQITLTDEILSVRIWFALGPFGA